METIKRYFPNLSEKQVEQFAALYDLYYDWNSKINVISRKDIEKPTIIITTLIAISMLFNLGRLNFIHFTNFHSNISISSK